jgi:hypothetical protein
MTNMIEKMQGVTMWPAADKLLGKVAEAITAVEVSSPNAGGWMDRKNNVAIKAGTREELVRTLTALGVYTIPLEAALVLAASGHRLPMSEIDAALAKGNVETQDRIRLKAAADRFGLLKK